jgi:glycosyltransferase involved in cell wall biosynthesis
MGDPAATVLLSTRDRAEHLGPTLDGILASARHAPFEVEVLLVDNGSTDRTPELLAGMARDNPEIVVREDPVPGKSGALNRALGHVRGRAIVFTDDDVHVPTSWVEDMAGPILDGAADAVCGKVVLAAHLDRPWLTPALRTDLAEYLDVSGSAPGMVGANMAASTEAARSIGFDEELGPGARGFADDVLFNLRLKAGGYRLTGCTGPAVEHHLSPDRLNRATMQRLARSNGSSHAYLWHHWLHADLRWLRLRRLRAQLELARLRRSTPEQDGITEREYQLWYARSFATELAVERGTPRNYPDGPPPRSGADDTGRGVPPGT